MVVGAGRGGAELLASAAQLVAVSSVSGEEAALAALVEERLRELGGLEVTRIGDNVVARTTGTRPHRLLLAGHLDTVPPGPAGRGAHPRTEDDVLEGLGAVDMKAGVAVLLALAAEAPAWEAETSYVFYAREEVARSRSGLLELAAARPDLLGVDAAVLGEPTGGVVEAGCQGVLRATVRVCGRRGHVARPWTGVNALHRLGAVLERLERFPGHRPVIDGCEYRESLQAVGVQGGIASNVIPDAAAIRLSYRFAPDRDGAQAEAFLRGYLAPALRPADGDELAIDDLAPAAPPALGHPLLAALVRRTGAAPRAKLGWTDVAFFAERGVPAVNFGPGDSLLAHTDHERVSAAELGAVATALSGVLAAPS